MTRFRRALLVLCTLSLALASATGDRIGSAAANQSFASDVARLSEAGGFFDTDNLISNEMSYAEIVPALVSSGATGGAYLGVGPDQNFSYIARVRPQVAFIVDIRRDNLLLHLLLKAVFLASRNRVEYLSLLTGRPVPDDVDQWSDAPLEKIVGHVERASEPESRIRALQLRMHRIITGFGVPISSAEVVTIERFHRAFIEDGLELRFHTFGRAPQFYYPNFRELLLATDKQGRAWNYLASEADYQFVRQLEVEDRVIPVVGDLGGTHAMPAVAAEILARGLSVSAFYVSNVEHYLSGDAQRRFLDNLKRLPRTSRSVLIRSNFSRGASSSTLESIETVLSEGVSARRANW